MTRQAGNQIDEFVTSALRNNLLGLPLELATINLARGRETGVPSLNEARRAVLCGDRPGRPTKALRELDRFRRPSQARSSIINFIAAYGTHAADRGRATIEGKRAAAMAIVFGTPQIVSGPETTGVTWNGPEGVAWIGLATPASSIDENILVDDAYYNFERSRRAGRRDQPRTCTMRCSARRRAAARTSSPISTAPAIWQKIRTWPRRVLIRCIHFLAFGRFEGRLFYSVAIDENILVDDGYYSIRQSRRASRRGSTRTCALRYSARRRVAARTSCSTPPTTSPTIPA